jgi:hypothetical protein
MTNPDFPYDALLFILGLLSGFGTAIWLAITFDQGAREIAEKADDETQNVAEP